MPTRAVAPEGRSMLDLLPQGMLRDVAEFMGVGGPPDPSDLISPLGMASGPARRSLGELARKLFDSPVYRMRDVERRLPGVVDLEEATNFINHPEMFERQTSEAIERLGNPPYPLRDVTRESGEEIANEFVETMGDSLRGFSDATTRGDPDELFKRLEGDDDLWSELDALIHSMRFLK